MTPAEDLFTAIFALGRSTRLAQQAEYRVMAPPGDNRDTMPDWIAVSHQTLTDLYEWTEGHHG
jgi:hypothetical protein